MRKTNLWNRCRNDKGDRGSRENPLGTFVPVSHMLTQPSGQLKILMETWDQQQEVKPQCLHWEFHLLGTVAAYTQKKKRTANLQA